MNLKAQPDTTEPWTVLKVLDWTRAHFEQKGVDTARLDAEVILSHVLGMERIMLYARFDQPLLARELAEIRALVARRARREPVAYLVKEREFWSLPFEVTPAVLIPRPDTEALVEATLSRVRDTKSPVIVDVGTGSGCVAIALAIERPDATIFALDISPKACEIAIRNRDRHGLSSRIHVLESDLFEALASGGPPIDAVAANLPYIPMRRFEGLMPEVRDFEPRGALIGGDDGLDIIRRLVDECAARLSAGARVALEVDPEQAGPLLDILRHSGFSDGRVHRDGSHRDRVVSALR